MSKTHTPGQHTPTAQASNGYGADCPPAPIMSPRLLKRLAEAALGHRGGGEQWWVCRFEPNPDTHKYDINGPHPDEDTARGVVASLEDPKGFGVFGPYRWSPGTGPDTGDSTQALMVVENVWIKIQGTDEPLRIEGQDFDALFWGMPALEKFVLPYYTSASGLDYATKVRNEYVNQRAYAMVHSDDTEYRIFGVTPSDDGKGLMLSPII